MTRITKPNTVFWIVAIGALLWNLMGVFQFYLAAFNLDMMVAELPEEQANLYRGFPLWYFIVFAVAVFSGLLACITMLVRKKITVALFGISLVAVLVSQFYWLLFTDVLDVLGTSAAIMPVIVIIISIFLFYYSKGAAKNGWLR